MRKLLISFLLSFVITSHEQNTPPSPCPAVFSYEKVSGEETDRWYGTIRFPSRRQRWLFLNVILDKKAELFGTDAGEVTTADNIDFKIDNTNMINKDQIRFFVKHGLDMAPMLSSIRMDGREICINDYQSRDSLPTTPPPTVYSLPPPASSPEAIQPTFNIQDSNEQCGQVKLSNPIPLVLLGTPTQEGQWPWQVALYRTEMVNQNFICGGTLISRKHVITAAHCTTIKDSQPVQTVNSNELSVYLGKHHLIKSIRGVQFRFVEKNVVHSEYNTRTFSNDIAMLHLQQSVDYTDYVQPACLWPENMLDIKNVIGKSGSVVGWGNDGSGLLHLVEMPVVSEVTCIRSKPEFYSKVTSDTTYCAGFRNGRSACNGDSGGGMVFQIGSSWYLRGLVSVSPAKNPHEPVCDPMQYVVFTDVAKYRPWIRQNMS